MNKGYYYTLGPCHGGDAEGQGDPSLGGDEEGEEENRAGTNKKTVTGTGAVCRAGQAIILSIRLDILG